MSVITKTLESTAGLPHVDDDRLIDVTEGRPSSLVLTGKLAERAVSALANEPRDYSDHQDWHQIAEIEDDKTNGRVTLLTVDGKPGASVVKIHYYA